MSESATTAKKYPHQAAHEAVLELIKATGAELFKGKNIDINSGKNAAECLTSFHKTLSTYYKTLE